MALHDPTKTLLDVKDAIERLLRSRLCASTPAQMGYLAGLNNDRGWMNEHRRIVAERREIALTRIQSIDGLEVEPTGGAFYMFVRITHPRWKNDDKQFVLSLLQEDFAHHDLLSQGAARFLGGGGAGSGVAPMMNFTSCALWTPKRAESCSALDYPVGPRLLRSST